MSDSTLTRRRMMAATVASFILPRLYAQERYPSKPIKLVVPFAPGGTSDVLARLVGLKMSEATGQAWIIDNRPGAGGNIAAELVARSPNDGYTLFLGFDGTLVINPHIYQNLSFDPLKDFAPISKIADVPLAIVANAGLRVSSLADLSKLARQRPGGLNFGSAGAGSTGHLVGELIGKRTGIPLTHVPYKGGSAALNDLLGGTLDLMIAAIPAFIAYLRSEKLKFIGVSSIDRVRTLPNVPTLAESGLPGFDVSSWYGLLAPAGTAAGVVNRIQAEMAKALAVPEVVTRLDALGAVAIANSPENFRMNIANDLRRWGEVVKSAGIQAQ